MALMRELWRFGAVGSVSVLRALAMVSCLVSSGFEGWRLQSARLLIHEQGQRHATY
jgi:hypothetical protein